MTNGQPVVKKRFAWQKKWGRRGSWGSVPGWKSKKNRAVVRAFVGKSRSIKSARR